MQSTDRSTERRWLLRAAGTGVLTAAALGVAAGATFAETPAAGGAPPAISTHPTDAIDGSPLAAGVDGAMWTLQLQALGRGADLVRYGGSGVLSRASAAVPWAQAQTPLTPQADGGMVVVTSSSIGTRPSLLRLRADARGRRVTTVRLPRSARSADAFAVASDGAVWWADSCADALRRWLPGQPVASVRMPPEPCSGATQTAALAIGPDGAVWYVNTRQGRIVRRDVRGKVRQWNVASAGAWASTPEVAVDPRGGSVAFGDPSGRAAGLVTRAGRIVRTSAGAPAFAPDGTLWRAAGGELVSRRSDGRSSRIPLPPGREAIAVAIARAGAPWLTSGRLVDHVSAGFSYADVAVGTALGGGLASWAISRPDRNASLPDIPKTPVTLGGDGALWTWVRLGDESVVRIVPPGLRAPRRPVARVTGVLARNGRTVVLQVRCSAERGRFCRGAVGLGGSAKAVRYVAPGQSGTAVSLTLTRRAAARLRRAGGLKLGAQIRSTGAGTTRATVRLRR